MLHMRRMSPEEVDAHRDVGDVVGGVSVAAGAEELDGSGSRRVERADGCAGTVAPAVVSTPAAPIRVPSKREAQLRYSSVVPVL